MQYKFPDMVKDFLAINHSKSRIEIMEYIHTKMMATNDWVDLRPRKIQAYFITKHQRTIYHVLENLNKTGELIRIRIKSPTKWDLNYFVGLLNYAGIIKKFRDDYPILPINKHVLNLLAEYQNKVIEILHNSELLRIKANEEDSIIEIEEV